MFYSWSLPKIGHLTTSNFLLHLFSNFYCFVCLVAVCSLNCQLFIEEMLYCINLCWLHRVEMIEITAKLPRRSVFLAGETIECLVTVANVIHSGHHKGNGNVGASAG